MPARPDRALDHFLRVDDTARLDGAGRAPEVGALERGRMVEEVVEREDSPVVRGPGPKTAVGTATTFQVEFPDFQHVGHRRGDHLYLSTVLATTAATTTGRCFLYHRCSPAMMPSGEDTRLYNYGVPVIGRSKLRLPAPREQEYAARARRAALRQI